MLRVRLDSSARKFVLTAERAIVSGRALLTELGDTQGFGQAELGELGAAIERAHEHHRKLAAVGFACSPDRNPNLPKQLPTARSRPPLN